MKTYLALTVLFSSLALYAAEDNYFTIIGGGGEPVGAKSTQFDTGTSNLSRFYQANKNIYKTTINFNGGHPVTEALIADKYKDATIENGFNQASFDRMVNEYIRKLTANPPEIKEGDKILLFINDHGGETQGKTHSIAASASAMQSLNSGSHGGMISLDSLAKLTEATEKANVKLGIIDASCHSGNSLPLANSKTCVVTASGPKHYGYSSFAEMFANKMEKGKNLEDVFLETRNAINGAGFPEISSPEGVAVQDELYPLLTPYMYYHDEYRGMSLDKIDTYLKEKAPGYESQACERQNEYVKLTTILALIEDVKAVEKKSFFSKKITMEKTVDLSALKKKIQDYKDVQENYIKRLGVISLPLLDTIEPITVGKNSFKIYTHKKLLDGNWDYYIADKNKDLQDPSISEEKRKSLIYDRDYYEAAKKGKEKILRENPQYTEYASILNELKTNNQTSQAIASSIAREANTAYYAYYKNKQKKDGSGDKNTPNPCKDFVL